MSRSLLLQKNINQQGIVGPQGPIGPQGPAGSLPTIESKNADFVANTNIHYEVTTLGNLVATVVNATLENAGEEITFARVNSTDNIFTVTSPSTINGNISITIAFQNSAMTIRSTGSIWRII